MFLYIKGVDIIGINCRFDPDTCVETTIRMRTAVEKAGMKCHYMVQPIAFRTADAGRLGFVALPECPLGIVFFAGNKHRYIYSSHLK